MTSTRSAIQTVNLTKAFPEKRGAVTAYADISLSVRSGEFLCIVGPSGCGKTTLLRTIANLEAPTTGSVNVNIDNDNHKTPISMVFQEHGLFPWMNVYENLAFPLRGSGRFDQTTITATVKRLLERIGLQRFESFYPHQLSGGMRQRLSVARGFATDPAILLMDEPFVFLDYQTRQRLQTLLLEIWENSGKSVIFVTHDLEEAVILADRVIVLTSRPGRIKTELNISLKRPRDIYGRHKSPEFLAYVDELNRLLREEAPPDETL